MTVDVVNDPESYVEYVERKRNIRLNKCNKDLKEDKTPGKGHVFQLKPTVIKEFMLTSSNKPHKKCLSFINIFKPNKEKYRTLKLNKKEGKYILNPNKTVKSKQFIVIKMCEKFNKKKGKVKEEQERKAMKFALDDYEKDTQNIKDRCVSEYGYNTYLNPH